METVAFSVDDGVGTLTLDRPNQLNALNGTMCAEAEAVLEDAKEDEDVHVIVLEGRGETFCAGADLNEMEAALQDLEAYHEWASTMISFLETLEYHPKPVVASVEGVAFAGGFELTLLCDIVVATEDTNFRLPEAGLGIVPGTAAVKLKKVVPKHRALEIMMTAKTFSAETAREYGLVNQVVSSDDLDAAVQEVTANLQNVPQQSHALLKEIWHRDPDSYDFWYDDLATILQSETAARGREAFREGENPPWVSE